MSRGDTRGHRRGRNDNTPPPADRGEPVTAQPVTLESRETEAFLLHRLHTANADAHHAQQKAQAADAEALRQDQIAAQLDNSTKELAAQIQQLKADKETAEARAAEARNASDGFSAQHGEFNRQAADAMRLCAAAGIEVRPMLPPGVDPAGPTSHDLNGGDPLAGPLGRFHEAHDEQDQRDAQSAGAL